MLFLNEKVTRCSPRRAAVCPRCLRKAELVQPEDPAAELNVHVDRMDGGRVGYNIMGALTFTGTDEHGP